jgi:DNA topoisomerase-2
MSKRTKPQYDTMTQIEHALERPDMYMDSVKSEKIDTYVVSVDRIIPKTIDIPPALSRIFIEIISNAVDNNIRSKNSETPMTSIKINIDQKTGETIVWNDGMVIPVEIHEKHNVYNHTLVFSEMLSSSNYRGTRDGSGLNGLGCKLTSIYSTFFQVKGFDPSNKKLFTQVWKKNLSSTTGPTVSASSKFKKGFTEVTFIPDFKRFGVDRYSDDIINLFHRFAYDCAMITGLSVHFNDDVIKIKDLLDYSKLYDTPETDYNSDDEKSDNNSVEKSVEKSSSKKSPKSKSNKDESIFITYKECAVVLKPATDSINTTISFVNGIYTKNGGVHVKPWYDAFLSPVLAKINKKGESQLTIDNIKQCFKLFVVCNVIDPVFDTQCKHTLKSPGVEAQVPTKCTNQIMKWSIIQDIKDMLDVKNMSILKKT